MKEIDRAKVDELTAKVNEEAGLLTLVREELTAAWQELCAAACPWEPGDFVKTAEARGQDFQVLVVLPGDMMEDDEVWKLKVRDRRGTEHIITNQADVEQGEPFEVAPGGEARGGDR